MTVYGVFRGILKAWFGVCYRFEVRGAERIPPSGGAIVASNHVSILDPMALGCAARRPLTYVARGTLTESRLYAALTRRLDIVAIRRGEGDRAALQTIVDQLKAGKACVVFPEGTRSPDGRLAEFKGGIALMARQAGVPVVPAYVAGSFAAWPKSQKLPRPFGRIRVAFGDPIRLDDGAGRDEALARLRAAIEALRPAEEPELALSA